jgi:DNA modification methylase
MLELNKIYNTDALEGLKQLDENSIDAIISDPPYQLTTRENDIVLDPFIGSGTTAMSSILLKRRFIGFEREEEYYKIATERIKFYQKQEVL